MPGFSLWLVPPESSRVYQALSALIATALPSQFPAASPPEFGPHVTLTSDVFSEAFSQSQDEEQQKRDAQAWLDGLALPTGRDVKVRFEALDVGERGTMPISEEKKAELQTLIEKAGISIDGSGELGGWEGGDVWLVPTFLEIPNWQPWVKRTL
ncbi:hypothetical protein SLS57_003086 [Botryosphaeria dothidea]